MLGTAIHSRIAFGFGDDPPVTAFRGYTLVDGDVTTEALTDAYQQGHSPGTTPTLPSGVLDFAGRLGQFTANYDLAAPQPPPVERTLAKALWVLALWEGAYRGDDTTWWPGPAATTWTAGDWLGLAPDYAVADIAAVAELFTTRGRDDLVAAAGSDVAVVGPVYVPGWADADLVVGSCLVEVKATVNPGRLNPTWIWQLCCYAWLDGHVDTIAIHLARQGRTVAFDLRDTVDLISGGNDPGVVAGRGRSIMREAAASAGRTLP